MRKTFLAVLTVFCMAGCCNSTHETQNAIAGDSIPLKQPSPSREDTINAMATAFARQETNFNRSAVSPCGRWVGCLQISKICVAEANRIIGDTVFFDGSSGYIDDRLDRQGSYAIFKTVQNHHNPGLDIDRAIDVWNKKAGSEYRNNVKSYYAEYLYNNINYFELP